MALSVQHQALGAQLAGAVPFRPWRPEASSSSVISASLPKSGLSPRQTHSHEPLRWIRKKALVLSSSTVAAAASGAFLFHLASGTPPPGNPGGGGGCRWGSGGGGDGGGFWSKIFSPLPAIEEEDQIADDGQEWDSHGLPANIVVQLNKLSSFKKYKISEILFFDRQKRTAASGTEDSFSEMVSLHPGGVYTKAQLQKELETLVSSRMFEKVELEGKTKPDGTIALTVSFTENTWKSADSFRCINVGLIPKQMEIDSDMTEREKLEYFWRQEKDYKRRIDMSRPCLLPISVQRELQQMLREQGKLSTRLLQRIRMRVQKWYQDEGYACARVVNFGNLNTGEVVCEVVEGDITELDIQFQDNLGNICEGNTHLGVVRRQLPKQLRRGHVFNIEAAKQALRNITSLALFSKIEVNRRPDEKNADGIILEIKLKELNQKSAEVNTEWCIIPGQYRRPTLESIQPKGNVSFEHRNIKGLNRSILGCVTFSNLLNPQDDLAFKLEYVHPYLDGVYNPRNRTLRASCFNNHKLSPVFTSGSGVEEVASVWIDRVGFKANVTESFTRQSKFTYGLVLEEITTLNESRTICTHVAWRLPTLSVTGPPTTLSGTGIDRLAFLQANFTRDNTKFVNGTIVGDRNVFELDQGLGIGSKFPLFNRHRLTSTSFLQLKAVEEGDGKPPPPVLVLHWRYGGCVGDLPGYDAFPLGGPFSVRGYNNGELGACRNFLELAAELRIPVRNTHMYVFAEHGNDLGSSKEVKGNPTEFFRRAGHGSSYGAGVKLGLVRMEYAVDHNARTGALFFRFGERF